ncbi:MAG: hypothetical protein AAGH15_20700 [Myxococcota bacterium]
MAEDFAAAPQYRHDPMTDGWRIVAPSRKQVPLGERAKEEPLLPEPAGPCPFCPGREGDTEPTVWQDPPEGPWVVRVAPNKYPAVRATDLEVPAVGGGHVRPGAGIHEVIVEGPDHDGDLATFEVDLLRRVLRAYRQRVRTHEEVDGIRHVSLFRNRGRRAGSSQPHPHAQVLAATVLGPAVRLRWDLAREHERREGETLLSTVVERELRIGDRLVEAAGNVIAFCPFAPATPYETWVAMRGATGPFGETDDAALDRFAEVLQRALRRAIRVSGRQAYNVIFRLPPTRARRDPAAFWYAELIPRSGPGAGLEMASGMPLVWVTPEDAAARMRALSL